MYCSYTYCYLLKFYSVLFRCALSLAMQILQQRWIAQASIAMAAAKVPVLCLQADEISF
jgi:hypothetical protein